MWDLFPKSGIEPRPPSLRAWSLSHWKYQRSSPSPLHAGQCDLVTLLYQTVDSTPYSWIWACLSDPLVTSGGNDAVWLPGLGQQKPHSFCLGFRFGMFSLGMLLLGNQQLCCEKPKAHREVTCRWINPVIAGTWQVNEELLDDCSQLLKSLLATETLLADDRDIEQQRTDIFGVLFLNS